MSEDSNNGFIKIVGNMSRPGVGVLPSPIEKVRNISVKSLLTLLGKMFDQADDTLFQMADRAGTDIEQNHYFESMRELRVKRRGTESSFTQQLAGYFNALPTLTVADSEHADSSQINIDSLSIVKNDELEESVAIDGMILKARSNNIPGLATLIMRIDTLLPYAQLTSRNNPLDPQQICKAFAEASKVFELDIKAKLIVFKFFDKNVLAYIEQVLAGANKSLIDDGILPGLTHEKIQAQEGLENDARRGSLGKEGQQGIGQFSQQFQFDQTNEGRDDSEPEGIPTLIQVAPQQNINQTTMYPSNLNEHGTPSFANQNRFNVSQQILPQPQLMYLLNELQQRATDGEAQGNRGREPINHNDETLVSNDLRATIENLLIRKLQSDPRLKHKHVSVAKTDNDVIDLVAMLFEFILNDENLSEFVKAKVSRLQIPVLKVAITDKSFFELDTHPLRCLLNKLVQAGIGLSDKEEHARDKLYTKLDEIVVRVLTEFDTNVDLFDELLEDFSHFTALEECRTRITEQRIKDSEEGKARAERARAEANGVIHDKVRGLQIPTDIVKMLHGPWTNYLFLICLKHGKKSVRWDKAVNTVDDLLWSINPIINKVDHEKRLLMIPELLENLEEGLEAVSYSPFEKHRLFEELREIHVAQAFDDKFEVFDDKGEVCDDKGEVCDDSIQSYEEAEELCKQLEEFDETIKKDSVTFKGEEITSKEPDSAEKINTEETSSTLSEETSSTLSEEPQEYNDTYNDTYNDAYIDHVKALDVGAWVEFKAEDNSKVRCKLAAKIKAVDKLIFVNRGGVKVAEKTTEGLCVELRRGTVKFLDDALLFDRALESVIGTSRESESNSRSLLN